MRPAKKTRRRCPTVTTSEDATGEFSTLWTTSLPVDLLLLIAWRVLAGDFLDYVRFRVVCRPWRDGTVCPRSRGLADPRFHPRRWLMFPEGHRLHPGHYKLHGHLRFLNLDTGTFVRVKLPHFRHHCILDSVDGLLLLQRDHDAAVRLLHPFTGNIAELPPLSTLLPQLERYRSYFKTNDRWFFITLGMLAAVSCDVNAGTITVMILLHRVKVLAFATTQDTQWNMPNWHLPPHAGPISFHGKIYMVLPVYHRLVVFQIDPPPQAGSPPLSPKLVATLPIEKLYNGYKLVECDSRILLVGYSRSHISIYKLEDIMLKRFVPVTSIGDHAIFLGYTSLSVSTKAMPTVMAETVVLKDPVRIYRYTEYHLGNGTWSPAVDECGIHGYDPGPRSLIQHIITCCIRSAWNKGKIYSEKEAEKVGWLNWKVKRKFRHWT